MAKNEKIQVAIYHIDSSIYGDGSFDDIVIDIVRKINKKEGQGWKEEKVTLNADGFEVRIYSEMTQTPPAWRSFLRPVLPKTSRLADCVNTVYHYLCFISTGDGIFLMTGGMGTFPVISEFISPNFGLDILVRLIDKDSPVVKGLQDRGVTGVLLGQQRHFRDEQRLVDEENFGRIYREVSADLHKRILVREFKFSKDSLKRIKSGCLATNSFKLKKSIDFETAVHLCGAFSAILKKRPRFALNNVLQINRNKHNRDLLDRLNNAFVEEVYNAFKTGTAFDGDFLHPEYEKYLEASQFFLQVNDVDWKEIEEPPDLADVIELVKKNGGLYDDSGERFKYSVLEKYLRTVDENGIELTNEKVFYHLHGEMNFDDHTYFRVDGEWYLVQPSFIKELNEQCEEILVRHWDETLILDTFDIDKDEGEFNRRFIGRKDWYVLDTVTPENIELCDLMWDGSDEVYVVAVKKGFDNALRDLTAQITIAAKRLHQDSRDNYKFVEKVQDAIAARKSSKSPASAAIGGQTFLKGGLKSIFHRVDEKNIFFCLAFVDTAKKDRALKGNVHHFKSNIAKYFLIQLYRAVISLRYDFKVIQLKRN